MERAAPIREARRRRQGMDVWIVHQV